MQNNGTSNTNDIFDMVKNIANNFDGKSNKDLLLAIYKEAKKGKENGTLSNDDIDGFSNLLTPFLDDKQQKILNKIAIELKKI